MWRRRLIGATSQIIEPMTTTINTGVQPLRLTCAELRSYHVGSLVELAGSLHQQRLQRFFLLKDAYGATQLVIPNNRPDIGKRLKNLPLHSFISIIGWVMHRPPGAFNESMITGKIEVSVEDVVMVRVNRNNKTNMNNGTFQSVRNMSTCVNSKSLTTEEYVKCGKSEALKSKFQKRIFTCGSLSIANAECNVTLVGWVNGLQLSKFLKLKDGYGTVQCLLPPSRTELIQVISKATLDDIVEIQGVVTARPQHQINTFEQNGDIEIIVDSINILDKSAEAPEPETNNEIEHFENAYNHSECREIEIGVNSCTWRTHTCGDLRPENVGQHVTLCGWLQYCRANRFLILRDSYGSTQCIVSDEKMANWSINKIPLESTLEIKGIVGARPPASINNNLQTGTIEVLIDSLRVLNKAVFSPFSVRNFNKPKEELQLEHRYLYLRYPEMQHNLRTRSDMLMKMRKFLIDSKNFVEVETPTLFCRTPGGSREFVVPTKYRGQFYSLIQSPQQHKQMLMAGAIDRYFQIARCYRDESTRGDRQPEFTQLDVEVSFAGREEILTLMEELFRNFWPQTLSETPFVRLNYQDAIQTYGSDKPDVSYDLKLKNVSKDVLHEETEDIEAFALVLKNNTSFLLTKSHENQLKQIASEFPDVKYTLMRVKEDNSNSYLGESVMKRLSKSLDLSTDDYLFLAIGNKENCCFCLGNMRTKLASDMESENKLERNTHNSPLWVIDFPLFVKGENGKLETCHHPFTAPHHEDVHLLSTEPLKVRSLAYDLVLNGNEVGGGSVRVHDSNLQLKLFDMLKISPEPMRHLINALECGCPPHAGIALGIDRLVAIACNSKSIREVIAFPKNHEGRDPLSGAPNTLSEEELDFYKITITECTENKKRLRY